MIALLWMLGQAVQDDAERLKRLEEQVRRQQAEIDELRSEWSANLSDGLRWRTKDGAFDVHAGGRFEEQFRQVFGRPDSSRTSPDSFYVREAVLSIEGMLFREFGFVVTGDFASPAGLEEAYLEWKRYGEFTVRFGQFRTPNGQEALTPTPYTDCIERSILSRFVPEIQLGIQAAGEIAGGRFGYQVALINGRSDPSNPDRATTGTSDDRDVLVRLTSTPFIGDSDFLRQLRVGVYGSVGGASDVPLGSGVDLVTTELGVTVLDPTAGLLDGRRWRAGVELSYVIGPASVRGEFLWRKDGIRDAADTVEEKLPVRAWYGQFTLIVFGAEKLVESGLTPAQPLELSEGRWGAVEAVFRAAGATVGAGAWESVGNSIVGQSNRVLSWTAGVNWYPVRNVRLSANWIFEDYHRNLDFGNGVVREGLSGLLFRFQVEF
jgi:phosphate-selective porin